MVTGSNLKGVQKRGAGFVKTLQVKQKQKKEKRKMHNVWKRGPDLEGCATE